jgi:hypothetical protein
VWRRWRGEEGNLLFLKKKKQKDFVHWHSLAAIWISNYKSFLVLFFKKEHAYLFACSLHCTGTTAKLGVAKLA